MWVATHILSAKNINVFAIIQDGNFNITLANNFVKFWNTEPRHANKEELQKEPHWNGQQKQLLGVEVGRRKREEVGRL